MSSNDASLEKLFALLEEGNVASFGCSEETLPRVLFEKSTGRSRVFLKRGIHLSASSQHKTGAGHYEQLSEVREERSDVYFLDREALKVLLVDFPASAQYVLLRPSLRLEWLVALPGLVRRVLIGLVKIRGFVRLKTKTSSKNWLVVEHLLTDTLHTRLCLSEEVGVQGFLDYLNQKRVRYVVLRFFEKLPALYRDGGDLDLLVADEDERSVKGFLQKNPGPVGIDVWTVSKTTFNDITYYPPPLARKILESGVSGPAGARIPGPDTAFLALAYHVVYHKGSFAGVPTALANIAVNKKPENDYAAALKALARKISVDVPITMEGLDEYLNKHGWRPHLDTLAKISVKNRWVWERFFSVQPTKEIGLGVVILKRKAFTAGRAGDVIKEIEKDGHFVIIRTKKFDSADVGRIANKLRGGVWHVSQEDPNEYLPHTALVVLDVRQARRSHIGAEKAASDEDIRALKRRIRKTFDGSRGSIIHATDNSHESWEYIEVCFPDELTLVKDEIETVVRRLSPNPFQKIGLYAVFIPRFLAYRLAKIRRGIKNGMIRFVMRI